MNRKRITRDHLIHITDYGVEPAVAVSPGDSLWIETKAAGELPFLTGPVHVNGLSTGDTLAITIEQIRLGEKGFCSFAQTRKPWEPWGGVLREKAKEAWFREIPIRDGMAQFSSDIQFPVRPNVGWIGLILPKLSPGDPWDHGGNMDTNDLGEGSTLYLHNAAGSTCFLLGDVHASMGDGEVSGTGVEISAEVLVRVDVIRNTAQHRPLIETQDHIVTVASRQSHEESYTLCIEDMADCLMKARGISFAEANALLGAIGDLRISSVVAHVFTYRLQIPRELMWRGVPSIIADNATEGVANKAIDRSTE